MSGTGRAERIEAVLRARLAPLQMLEVLDDSAHHAGHAGARAGGETHYTIRAIGGCFAGLNRIARSRLVHDLLADEFAGGLHAVSLTLRTPSEAG